VTDSTEPMGRKVFADTMTSGEMAAHRRRNGIVLLPLGCFEMHGVHVGMSCDSFIAEAICRYVAEDWDAVILPTIHYTFPGGTGPWPGSVAVRPEETYAYVLAVVKAILRNGFKRVVLVNLHGPSGFVLQMVLRQLFEETSELPILFAPRYGEFCRRVEEEFGHPHGEAACYLASLYTCGRHGEFDPSAAEDELQEGPGHPFESYGALRRHSAAAAFYFTEPRNHVGRYPGLKLEDAPRLAEMWREVTMESAKGLPEDYERFQQDMLEAVKGSPWDGYEWPE
jgi:hypothetical protein